MRPQKILTWHVHGNYLYYLSRLPHEIYVPFTPDRADGYAGAPPGFDWPANMHEVPADRVRSLSLDCILFQSKKQYLEDQHRLLSPAQRRLPRIYLEHDPPQEHPTNTRHWVDDPDMLLVHVTPFNRLMWDSGRTPVMVIEHGVVVPAGAAYRGALRKGIVVVNNIQRRGRRLGADVYQQVRRDVPLDLVGMGAEDAGGIGEIDHVTLPGFMSAYRFFFNPIRYTSLGLSVCEAMMLGMPVVGLATTEMSMVVENGISGFIDTDISRLTEHMKELLDDQALAFTLGRGARRCAEERFNIRRFVRDWDSAVRLVTGTESYRPSTGTDRRVTENTTI